MILCIGEILADMIGTVKDGSVWYERKAGGAPFNVACAAKKFGANVKFAGSVGNDLIGDFLINFADRQNLDGVLINRDAKHNTTLAFVELDEKGERSFCFYRKNTADYNLPYISQSEFAEVDIVHIGSLMLSEKAGFEYAESIAKRARAAGKIISFDINYRTDIFQDRQSAVKVYKKIISYADIVKFSEDEVEVFTEKYIEKELGDKLVCISLGGNGSEWRYKGKSNRVPSIKVKPVDTTGAGDAFYAGVLSRLDKIAPALWTEETLNDVFEFANVCGALNTLGRGAIDCLPDSEDIARAMKLKSDRGN